MRRVELLIQRTLTAAFLFTSIMLGHARAQETLEFDRVGLQRHRDYLRLLPFEQLDTQSGNILLTFSDLVLPGNAGHDLRPQLTFNGNAYQTGVSPWSFGLAGLPMRIRQEQSWPATGSAITNTLDGTRDITPILQMADGGERRTVFTQVPNSYGHSTMNVVRTSDFWQYDRTMHTLTLLDHTTCTYEEIPDSNPVVLRLKTVEDVFGNLVELEWTTGHLKVTQTLATGGDRVVEFEMNDSTALPTSMAFNGRTWIYEYAEDPGRLTGITPPHEPESEPRWTFDYDGYGGRLDKVTTPYGGKIKYTYLLESLSTPSGSVSRVLLKDRDLYDRNDPGTTNSIGHWHIECDWAVGSTYCASTTVVTPSTSSTYFYRQINVPNPETLIDGKIGLDHVEVRDLSGMVLENDARAYTKLPVVGSTYPSAEILSRTIHRGSSTLAYTTSYYYNTADTQVAGYHCPVRIDEHGQLDRFIYRIYKSPYAAPFIPCLLWNETVTVGTESLQRDFWYDDLDYTGFVTMMTEFGVAPNNNILTTFTRDEGGNVKTATRSGLTTSFTYSHGQLATIATPLTTISRVINLDGTIASETRGSRTTFYEYDNLTRLTKTTPPGPSAPTTIQYDDHTGLLESIVSTRGSSSVTKLLDAFGRPTVSGNSDGVQQQTVYDAEGRVTYAGYPFKPGETENRGTWIEYDGLGRVIRQTHLTVDPNNPDVRTWSYGAEGGAEGTVTLTDENGHQTTQTWQGFGDPDDARLAGLVDAKNQSWAYEYHALGQLAKVRAPDQTERTWTYNEQNLLIEERHPESGKTTYSYSSGLLTSKTDANGGTTTYEHDANKRIERIRTGSCITTIGYEPDSDLGQWVSVAPLDGRNQELGSVYSLFLYDGAGRNTDRFDLIDGKMFATGYDYDDTDALVSIRYPTLGGTANRRWIGIGRDNEDRITSVFDRLVSSRNYATNFEYKPTGQVAKYVSGNLVTNTIAYDAFRYWPRVVNAGSFHLDYDYDKVGNVTSIADNRGLGQTFTYDPLDRLTRMDGSGGYPLNVYDYDVHGNPATVSGGITYTIDPTTLRLVSQNGAPRTYDSNGNLKTTPNTTFQYTPENSLETVSASGVVTSYVYDADGWRIKKTTNNSVTYYLRGLNGELLTEWTNPGPNGSIRDYVYADSRLLSVVTSSSTLDAGDVIGTTAVGGMPSSMTVVASGQNGRFMFNGAQGTTVSVTLTTQVAMTCNWTFSLLAPDGTTLQSATPCSGTSAILGPQSLPVTGTYVVLIDPVGTTTGSVEVRVTNATGNAPTISSVTPALGVAGTPVTIDGTHLQHLNQIPVVWFNGVSAIVTSATTDRVTVLVPSHAGSGRITLSTTDGTATSSADFFIPPTPYTATDVVVTARVPFGAATPITVSPANKVAILTFDRTAGQRFSVLRANQTIVQTLIQVYRPDGVQLSSGSFAPTGAAFIDTITATMSGTYSVFIDPTGSNTGNITVTVYDVPDDVSRTIVPGGTGVPLTMTTPGQNAGLTFFGTNGHRVAITGTSSTVPFSFMTLQAPDGTTLATANFGNYNSAIDATTLPLDGVYRVLVNPWDNYTGNATITLYDVQPDDVYASIATDDTPVTVSTPSPWQKAYVTFTATAGQRITLTVSNGTYGNIVNAMGAVLDPNQLPVPGGWALFYAGTSNYLDTKTLSEAGTYTIKIDPDWLSTGSVTLRVSTVPDDISGTITPGGSAVTVTTVKGQNATLIFTGAANQRISLRATNGTYGSLCNAYVSILKPPNNSTLVPITCMGTTAFIDTKTLTDPGTYTIKLDPQSSAVGSVTLTLYDVPADPTTTLTIGGGAQTLTTTTPGQNASATFNGTSGQQVTVHITNNTLGSTYVRLRKPDNTDLTYMLSSSASFNLTTQTLPSPGTYTVFVDPSATPNTGSISVSVTSP